MGDYGKVENRGSSEDLARDEKERKEELNAKAKLESHGSGLGAIAKYIKGFGGLRKKLDKKDGRRNSNDADVQDEAGVASDRRDFGTFRGSFSSFHDYPEKYPRCCVKWVKWRSVRIASMFSYLREFEWILQNEYAASGGEREQARLEMVQAVLIWLTTNIKNDRL
jgi:hypothetical protein